MSAGPGATELYVLQRIAGSRSDADVTPRSSLCEEAEAEAVEIAHRRAARPVTARSLLDAALDHLYGELRSAVSRMTLADVLELTERLEVLMVRHELVQVDGVLLPEAQIDVLGAQGAWSTALRWIVEAGRALVSRQGSLLVPAIVGPTLNEDDLQRMWALAIVTVEVSALAEVARHEHGDRFLVLDQVAGSAWPQPSRAFHRVQQEWMRFTAIRAAEEDEADPDPPAEQDLLLTHWRSRHGPLATFAGALAALADERLLHARAVIVDLHETEISNWLSRNRHIRPPDARRLLKRLVLTRQDSVGFDRWLSGRTSAPPAQDAPHRHRRRGSLLDRPIFAYEGLGGRRLLYGAFTLLRAVERTAQHELRDRRRDAVRGAAQMRARRKERSLRERLSRDPRVTRVIGGPQQTRTFIEHELGLAFDQDRDGDYDALALLPTLRTVLLVELKSRQALATSVQDQMTQYAKAMRERALERLERRADFLRRNQWLLARCMPDLPSGAMIRIHQRLLVWGVSAGECFALGAAPHELEPLPGDDLVDWLLERESRPGGMAQPV